MNSKLVKTLCIGFIMFFSVFFINIDNAEAKNDNGYAKCWYKIDKKYIKDKYDKASYGSLYILLHVKNRSTLISGCYMGSPNSAYTGFCNIGTLDRKVDLIENIHRKNSDKYKCPSQIYVYSAYEKDFWGKISYTHEGLLNLTVSPILEVKENLYASTATLTEHYELQDEENSEHNVDEADDNAILGDASDFKDGTPMDFNTPDNEKANKDQIINWGASGEYSGIKGNYEDYCSIINSDLKSLLNYLFLILSVIGVILLVIMTAVEFVKTVTGSDEDGIKTAFKNSIKRIVAIVILLLLPQILSMILNVVNDIGASNNAGKTITIGADGNPLCDIGDN